MLRVPLAADCQGLATSDSEKNYRRTTLVRHSILKSQLNPNPERSSSLGAMTSTRHKTSQNIAQENFQQGAPAHFFLLLFDSYNVTGTATRPRCCTPSQRSRFTRLLRWNENFCRPGHRDPLFPLKPSDRPWRRNQLPARPRASLHLSILSYGRPSARSAIFSAMMDPLGECLRVGSIGRFGI